MLRSSPALLRGLATKAAASSKKPAVVLVDGARIPFAQSSTIYSDYMGVDLQKIAYKGLIDKTAVDPKEIDYILGGTVIQEVKTSNIAREAAMAAGLPTNIPSHTVVLACISSNVGICSAAEKILCDKASLVLVGGVETFSDVPIRLTRPMRQALITLPKAMKKGPLGILKHLSKLKLKELGLETPAIANYTTGEVMGHSSDRLAAKFGVSRREQDEYAALSHQRAAKAHKDGLYKDEIIPVEGNTLENGIKGESTADTLAKLKPAFVKPHGTHTAANSSFLSDGASASLIASEEKALSLGFKPKAFIRAWEFVAVDPFEQLLLGPTYATAKVLASAGLTLADMDVVEIHEAFAGQVISNFRAMSSDAFAQEFLGRSTKVGDIDMAKTNLHGGSLSLGHPFAATGNRLVTTAANRLHREGGRYALITACADGGLGHACIIEKYE
ncbi:beta-ketoacyl-thiolase [Nannochloropsis oceanica]